MPRKRFLSVPGGVGDDGAIALKNAGLAPTKARPALYTNFCSTKSEEPLRVLRLPSRGLSIENEQSLRRFGKTIFLDLKIMAIPTPDTYEVKRSLPDKSTKT